MCACVSEVSRCLQLSASSLPPRTRASLWTPPPPPGPGTSETEGKDRIKANWEYVPSHTPAAKRPWPSPFSLQHVCLTQLYLPLAHLPACRSASSTLTHPSTGHFLSWRSSVTRRPSLFFISDRHCLPNKFLPALIIRYHGFVPIHHRVEIKSFL